MRVHLMVVPALLLLSLGCQTYNTREIEVEFLVTSTVPDPVAISYGTEVLGLLLPNTFPPVRVVIRIEIEDPYQGSLSGPNYYYPTCRGIYITARNERTGVTSRPINVYACERGAGGSQQPPLVIQPWDFPQR